MQYEQQYFRANVLITGGLGMIGSTLAHKLVAGGARVTILDALIPQLGANPHNLKGIENQVNLVIGDIRDVGLVQNVVRDKDVIFNLAAHVSYVDSMIDPLLDLDINCKGQIIFLEACRLHNPKAKVVFSSSRLQYGRVSTLMPNEMTPGDPLMFYGVHKMAGEKYHLLYNRVYGMDTTVARITNPYGPRHHMKHSKYGVVNWFIRQAMEGETIRIFGTGDQIRDYIYVEDIADALLALGASSASRGEVFNAGTGQGIKFSSMVSAVLDIVGTGRSEFVPWPHDYENTESGDFVADVTKIKSLLHWQPSTSLEDGITQTYKYYREHSDYYWSRAQIASVTDK